MTTKIFRIRGVSDGVTQTMWEVNDTLEKALEAARERNPCLEVTEVRQGDYAPTDPRTLIREGDLVEHNGATHTVYSMDDERAIFKDSLVYVRSKDGIVYSVWLSELETLNTVKFKVKVTLIITPGSDSKEAVMDSIEDAFSSILSQDNLLAGLSARYRFSMTSIETD